MKFCFFGNASDALKGKTPGGGELQIVLLAKALALKGHKVVIIDPYADDSFITKDGIELIHVPEWNKGTRGLRIFHRIRILKKLFVEQNADFYYVRMRVYYHFLAYKAARKLKKKFILAIASDVDLMSMWSKLKHKYFDDFNLFGFLTLYLPNDIVFHYLLKRADYVLIQHSGQKISQRKKKGKTILFPNIIDTSAFPAVKNHAEDYFIYAGSLTTTKGSDKLSTLVKDVEKTTVIMVVGEAVDSLSKKNLEKIVQNKNVVFKGRLPHIDTIELIARSKALINTSKFEGFPNIFLEAWAMGVPVISFKVDPGNVITRYNLGICCNGDLEQMKSCIESNKTQSIDRKGLIEYVSTFHSFNSAAERFLNLLNKAS